MPGLNRCPNCARRRVSDTRFRPGCRFDYMTERVQPKHPLMSCMRTMRRGSRNARSQLSSHDGFMVWLRATCAPGYLLALRRLDLFFIAGRRPVERERNSTAIAAPMSGPTT
jgi:hypothetical protein